MLKLVVIALAAVAARATDDDSRAAATVYQKDATPAVDAHIQRLTLDVEVAAKGLNSVKPASEEYAARAHELINKADELDETKRVLRLHNGKDLSYEVVKEKTMLRLKLGDLLAEQLSAKYRYRYQAQSKTPPRNLRYSKKTCAY